MAAIAGGVLREQVQEGQGIARKKQVQLGAARERPPECLRVDPCSLSGNWDEASAGNGRVSEKNREADYAFRTDGRYLNRRTVLHFCHHGDDAPVREIDVFERSLGLVKHLLEISGTVSSSGRNASISSAGTAASR